MIAADELDDDALVAVVSFQGAPLVGTERLPDARLMVKAIRVMEDHLGQRFDAVMAVEIGGSNALQPLVAAALMDLPVVDADGMGRAFPDVSKTSFAVRDLKPYPLSVVDCRDNSVIVTPGADWFWMERISRKVVTEMGSAGATCKAPRSGREVKDHAILGSITKALRIGQTVADARHQHTDPVQAVVEFGARAAAVSRQGRRHPAPHHGGFPARRDHPRGPGAGPGPPLQARLPERVLGRLAGRPGPHHRART